MPATKRHMNWTGVTFTPQGGSATAITGVTSIAIDSGGSLVKFSGDGDRYNTTVINDHNEPEVTVHSADLAAVRANPVGTVGTFTATLNDARNGTGTGAITYTVANSVVSTNSIQGAHRQFGQGVLTLTAFSTDGVTNPISATIAS
jgi:hypothetical protein